MNWISITLLAEISDDINLLWSQKCNIMHDIDISEDYLSIELVKTIREALTAPRADRNDSKAKNGFYLSIQAYKATGRPESSHGDIAIFVSDNDRGIAGTGFYETKRQSIDGNYPTFNLRQLQRLESNTPRLDIMVHGLRKEPVSDNPFDRNIPEDNKSSFHGNHSFCRALSVSWARKFRQLSDAASQRQPNSFGYYFVTRYLLGANLDYRHSPAKAIARWLQKTKGFSPINVEIKISESRDGLLRYEPALIPPGTSQICVPFIDQRKRLDQPEFTPIIVHQFTVDGI